MSWRTFTSLNQTRPTYDQKTNDDKNVKSKKVVFNVQAKDFKITLKGPMLETPKDCYGKGAAAEARKLWIC